jgi:hypothetical protein
MFPLELQTANGRVLRALLAVDEKEQSITFAGNVPEGATARFMVGNVEDLIKGTVGAATEARRQVVPELSLVVSCNARRAVLKQRVEEETEAVSDVMRAGRAVGFYSYGEIGPSAPGGRAELHNETLTITSFAEC